MVIHATYTGRVSAAPGEPDYRGRAQLLNEARDYEATVDNAAAEAILAQPRLALAAPGDTVPRVVGIPRWLHDDEDPDTGEPIGPVTISADLLGCSRGWTWTLVASRGSIRGGDFVKNPLGYEIDRGGPPPGRETFIDLEVDLIDYDSPATLTARLINGGQVRDAQRTGNDSEHAMALSGAGYSGRYARRQIDLKLEAGHGLTHGGIAVLACSLAGVPASEILIDPDLGAPRTRAINMPCISLWRVLKDVLAPIGYRPNDSRSPRGIAAFPVFIDSEGTPIMELNRSDIDSSTGVNFGSKNTGAPCIRVTGTDPTALAVPAAGTVTTVTKVEEFEQDRVFLAAVANQSGGGAIATTGDSDFVKPGPTLIARTTVRQTFTNGCLVRTRTTTEGYRLVEHHRYFTSSTADGKPYSYAAPVKFFGTVPVTDDAQDGFRFDRERFFIENESVEEIGRDAEGRELSVVTKVLDWGWPEESIKSRLVIADSWEDENFDAGVMIQGSGTGRFLPHEAQFVGPFRPDQGSVALGSIIPTPPGIMDPLVRVYLEQVELTRTGNECDEDTGQVTEFYRFGLLFGLTQFYADGTESAFSEERGRLEETTKVTRLSAGPTSRTEVTTGTAPDGRAGRIKPKNTIVQTGLVGALPNIPICLPDEIDDEGAQFIFESCIAQEEAALAEEGAIRELSSPFVETVEEARFWAELELDLENAIRVTIPLAYSSPLLDIGRTISVDLPEWGFSEKLCVIENPQTVAGDGRVIDTLNVRFSIYVG